MENGLLYVVRIGTERIERFVFDIYELQDENGNHVFSSDFSLPDLLALDDFKEMREKMKGCRIVFTIWEHGCELRVRTASEVNTYRHSIGDRIAISTNNTRVRDDVHGTRGSE